MGYLTKQHEPERSSQRWLQYAVNEKASTIVDPIRKAIALPDGQHIRWVSPLKEDRYTEYHDASFLERLGTPLVKVPLEQFWPSSGPRWDGLGRTDRGEVLLVEATSHVGEMMSGCTATRASLVRIKDSLDKAKRHFRARPDADWTRPLYQYANRLAHLYLMRELNGIDAWLVNVYFVNDREMKGPASIERWQGAIEMARQVLGLGPSPTPFTIDVFVDVLSLVRR